MCGIYASISKIGHVYPSPDLKKLLYLRGPDHVGEATAHTKRDEVKLLFVSTVLALRGGNVTAQPLTDPVTGSTLCWNGEAWRIGDVVVEGNDGGAILALLAAKTSGCSSSEAMSGVLEVIQSLSGPFAFVFYDKSHNLLYFGRDRLGRRSLLYNIEDFPGAVQLSSLPGSTSPGWREVEADGIYILQLIDDDSSSEVLPLEDAASLGFPFLLFRFGWHSSHDISRPDFSLVKLNSSIPETSHTLDVDSPSVKDLEQCLSESLKLRVLGIPAPPNSKPQNNVRMAILFSGGLDCTVLARMVHEILPIDQYVDLLNVAFENPRVVQALKQRQNTGVPDIHKLHTQSTFSDKVWEDESSQSAYELCPDRITGRCALKELRDICPMRKWRFVEVNVPFTETLSHRSKVVSLISPHNTEMDLSIAYALYFASRGVGQISTEKDVECVPYATPARVLLSGLGADELFGGYTRHATAFSRRGYPGLIEELELDVNRLGKRNLGRDDRVISNWGREARYPYLDEKLVQWALSCPVWNKCGFGTEPLEGVERTVVDLEPGKKVLRLLAYNLGMHSVAREKKRAIQFGARTAKMEVGRTKGTSLIS